MCAGMLSHQLKQHIIDGEKTIIQNPTDQQKWVHSESAFCLCLTSGWFCHFAFVERTMRKLSLRCMRYMQWMCLSAPERGRWEEVQKHFFFPLHFENSIKARNLLCFIFQLRQKMEVRGPPFTNETPTRCTAWRWRPLGHSSVRWRDASIRCLSLWGSNF